MEIKRRIAINHHAIDQTQSREGSAPPDRGRGDAAPDRGPGQAAKIANARVPHLERRSVRAPHQRRSGRARHQRRSVRGPHLRRKSGHDRHLRGKNIRVLALRRNVRDLPLRRSLFRRPRVLLLLRVQALPVSLALEAVQAAAEEDPSRRQLVNLHRLCSKCSAPSASKRAQHSTREESLRQKM